MTRERPLGALLKTVGTDSRFQRSGNPLETVLARLEGVHRNGNGWQARCPSHEDGRPSLSISEGADGKTLLKCHAGCETGDILAALGLDMSDLFSEKSDRRESKRDIVATYDYTDEAGELLYQVVRFSPKGFAQRRPDGRGGWHWKLGDVHRVLYRLPQVLEAVKAGQTVYVVEGEKDVHSLTATGQVATTSAGGAGKWWGEYTESLRGAHVVVIADDDKPGREHARTVSECLVGVAAGVDVKLPAEGSKDVSDMLTAGRTLDDLIPLDGGNAKTQAAHAPAHVEAAPTGDLPAEPGHVVLDALARLLGRYVAFATAAQQDAVTLWAVHTHAIAHAETTPRLAILSAAKQSGKTRLLEVLDLLAYSAVQAMNVSPAYLFRRISSGPITLLLDEADAIFGAKGNHEDLRALLNAGYRAGAVVGRAVAEGRNITTAEYPAFAPVALAGIGSLPDTVEDRSIIIRLRRRGASEHVEDFRRRIIMPEADRLRARLAAWVNTAGGDLGRFPDNMPDGLSDRAADCWEPLLAAADAAGGDWPQRARRAAVELATGPAEDSALPIRLLADCKTVFADRDRMASVELAAGLAELEDAPWGEWYGKPVSARTVAGFLRDFDIRPRLHRMGDGPARGYLQTDFHDSWSRYLPDTPLPPCNGPVSVTPLQGRSEAIFDRYADPACNSRKPALTCDVTDVTDKTVLRGTGTVTAATESDGSDPMNALGHQETPNPLPTCLQCAVWRHCADHKLPRRPTECRERIAAHAEVVSA